MKIAAVRALANLAKEDVPDDVAAAYQGKQLKFGPDYIIPTPFDPRLISTVPPFVAQAALANWRSPSLTPVAECGVLGCGSDSDIAMSM